MKAIRVDHFNSPKVSNGFRVGQWAVILEDKTVAYRYFSIPSSLELDEQAKLVITKFNQSNSI